MPLADDSSGTSIVPGVGHSPLFMTPTASASLPNIAPLPGTQGGQILDITIWTDNNIGDNEFPLSDRMFTFSPGVTGAAFIDVNAWFLENWWIFPRPVDFGNITTDKTLTVDILNAFRYSDHTFLSVNLTALPGVTVSANSPPFIIRTMEQLPLNFTAASAGVSIFDDDSIFVFSNRSVTVRMLGVRVILFPIPPEKPLTEQLSWKTNIMRSRDQSEQRHSLRIIPRQIVDMEFLPQTPVEEAQLRNAIRVSQPFLYGIPEWWDERPILNPTLADIAIGATVIPCNPDNAMFFADRSVIIIRPGGSSFDADLDSVQSGVSVTLTQPTIVPLEVGSAIIPLATGHLMGSPGLKDWLIGQWGTNLVFQFTSSADLAFSAAEFTANTFFDKHPLDGLLVMSDPNFVDGVTFSHEMIQKRTVVDSGVGQIDSKAVDDIAIPVRPKGVVLHNAADIWQWKKLLHFLRGSWTKFYLPTYQNDLPVNTVFDLSAASVVIDFINQTNIGFGLPYRDVLIRELNGAQRQFVKRVTNVIDNGDGTETVSFDSSPTGVFEEIAKENIMISWAILCRIDGDVATFEHEYLGEATLKMKVRGLVS